MSKEDKEKELREKQALQRIEALKKEAMGKLNEAEKIADENGIGFSWDLAYGMGGWYNPKTKNEDGSWNESNEDGDAGWQSSSNSC